MVEGTSGGIPKDDYKVRSLTKSVSGSSQKLMFKI